MVVTYVYTYVMNLCHMTYVHTFMAPKIHISTLYKHVHTIDIVMLFSKYAQELCMHLRMYPTNICLYTEIHNSCSLLGLLLFSLCFIQQYTTRIIIIMTTIAPSIPPITPPTIAPVLSSSSSVDVPVEREYH